MSKNSPARKGHKSNRANEQITLQAQDAPLNEAALLLGVSLRWTEDQLTRDMLLATAGQINCVGGVNGDLPTEITASDIQGVITTLLSNNAYTILDKYIVQLKSSLIDLEAEVVLN